MNIMQRSVKTLEHIFNFSRFIYFCFYFILFHIFFVGSIIICLFAFISFHIVFFVYGLSLAGTNKRHQTNNHNNFLRYTNIIHSRHYYYFLDTFFSHFWTLKFKTNFNSCQLVSTTKDNNNIKAKRNLISTCFKRLC